MQHTNKKINSTIETFKEWGMMENLTEREQKTVRTMLEQIAKYALDDMRTVMQGLKDQIGQPEINEAEAFPKFPNNLDIPKKDDRYRYIAVDKTGLVHSFHKQPHISDEYWITDNLDSRGFIGFYPHQFIQDDEWKTLIWKRNPNTGQFEKVIDGGDNIKINEAEAFPNNIQTEQNVSPYISIDADVAIYRSGR